MKINYKLEPEDIKLIIAEYMKKTYNMKDPCVYLDKEIHEGYGINEGEKTEVIVAKVTEW